MLGFKGHIFIEVFNLVFIKFYESFVIKLLAGQTECPFGDFIDRYLLVEKNLKKVVQF
ncbi:MAG: hypothetical protein ACJA01_000684 [Saprospiraceae bacterium]|jgi:hypothetical protein